ncbi:MAG: hypothetical protein QW570_09170, partial [Candidatus Caldarchaeum sp.]
AIRGAGSHWGVVIYVNRHGAGVAAAESVPEREVFGMHGIDVVHMRTISRDLEIVYQMPGSRLRKSVLAIRHTNN